LEKEKEWVFWDIEFESGLLRVIEGRYAIQAKRCKCKETHPHIQGRRMGIIKIGGKNPKMNQN
jgi:hypothetical protein